MEIAALMGVSFFGTLVWVLNAEATAVYYGAALGWPPLAVGLACACGQGAMFVVLYAGGDRIARVPWFAARLERVRERWRARLERWFLPCAALGGLVGVPPAAAMPALAPGFGVGPRVLLAVLFAGRLVRFTVLAAIGGYATA